MPKKLILSAILGLLLAGDYTGMAGQCVRALTAVQCRRGCLRPRDPATLRRMDRSTPADPRRVGGRCCQAKAAAAAVGLLPDEWPRGTIGSPTPSRGHTR
jgi:hypothetical protein